MHATTLWAKLKDSSRRLSALKAKKKMGASLEGIGGQKSKSSVSRALVESSNLAHRGMHAKFQPIWANTLAKAMGADKMWRLIL